MKSFLVLLFLATSSIAYSQVDSKAQSLISLHKKKFDWLINKKTDSLTRLLDDKVMYVHSNGVVETKAEIIEHLKNGVVTYNRVQVDEAKARFYGDMCIVTGRGTFEGKWGENSFALALSYTEVYAKVKKQWLLVSRHACRIIE